MPEIFTQTSDETVSQLATIEAISHLSARVATLEALQ